MPRNQNRVSQNVVNKFGISAINQIAWLDRSASWARLPRMWKAEKVLGAGGNGICGLFKYARRSPRLPKYMVVKQASRYGLREESKFLRMFTEQGSEHIVKLYTPVYREGGTGAFTGINPGSSWDTLDQIPIDPNGLYDANLEVDLMYLEYCPNGDLHATEKLLLAGVPPPEEYIWRIFECLGKAIYMMELGKEDPNAAPWQETPIAHFDIKPQNVFIGDHTNTHERLNIYKVGDFGISMQEPGVLNQVGPNTALKTAPWPRDTEWRATPGYMTPEQLYSYHQDRRIGHWTNVWAVGAVIHGLMTRTRFQTLNNQQPPQILQATFYTRTDFITAALVTLPQAGATFETFGPGIVAPGYSKALIELVLRCLAFRPDERAEAIDIINQTQVALAIIDQENINNGDLDRIKLAEWAGLPPSDVGRPGHLPEYTLAQILNAIVPGTIGQQPPTQPQPPAGAGSQMPIQLDTRTNPPIIALRAAPAQLLPWPWAAALAPALAAPVQGPIVPPPINRRNAFRTSRLVPASRLGMVPGRWFSI